MKRKRPLPLSPSPPVTVSGKSGSYVCRLACLGRYVSLQSTSDVVIETGQFHGRSGPWRISVLHTYVATVLQLEVYGPYYILKAIYTTTAFFGLWSGEWRRSGIGQRQSALVRPIRVIPGLWADVSGREVVGSFTLIAEGGGGEREEEEDP